MDDMQRFVMAVEYMRKCQIDYNKKFSDKAKAELATAEKNVDRFIKDYKAAREVKVGQNELFG